MVLCEVCHQANAQVIRPETGQKVCKHCFSICFEDEVLQTIRRFDLISPGDVVAIGVSGGKDSTVLMHVLHTLNQRYNLGFRIELVCIDEGIQGYRDNALETVKKNAESYGLPLTILSFSEMFGFSVLQRLRKLSRLTLVRRKWVPPKLLFCTTPMMLLRQCCLMFSGVI